jgi:hypothetical protein
MSADRHLADGSDLVVVDVDVDARVAEFRAWLAHDESTVTDDALERWALSLGEVGAFDEAAVAVGRIVDADRRCRLQRLLAEDASEDDPHAGDESAEDDLPLRESPRAADEAVVATFLRYFGGRRDLYAQQWYDERRRRSGYRPVHEPLTERVAREHLSGRRTIGQYLLGPDARAFFGVLDLDLGRDVLAALRAKHGDDASPLDHPPLRAHAQALMRVAASVGLFLYPEDSGGKGLHLWMFFDPPRPARAVRGVLGQIVASAPPSPPGVDVEIYPRQDLAGPRGLSSLVKLPLGVHQQTLRPCPLLDDELRPLDAATGLSRLRPAPPDALDALLGRRVVPLPAPELAPAAPLPPLPDASTPRSLAESLRALEGDEAEAAAERIVSGCDVVRWIVERAHTERRLSADELRTLVYTVGLVGPRNSVVERALAAAGASFQPLERARRGLPNPAGCKRVAALPGAPRCTGCPPLATAQPYPTPAIFAVGPVAPAAPAHAPFASWMDVDASVVASPFESIGESLRRIEARLERLEQAAPPSLDGGPAGLCQGEGSGASPTRAEARITRPPKVANHRAEGCVASATRAEVLARPQGLRDDLDEPRKGASPPCADATARTPDGSRDGGEPR